MPSEKRVPVMDVVLVAGTPGTRGAEGIKRLLDHQQANPDLYQPWILLPKFEELLREEYNAVAGRPKATTLAPLLAEPKPLLRKLWASALTDRVTPLLDSAAETGARLAFLPIHLVWYHQELREYVSVFDAIDVAAAIAPHQLSHVICMIDDIHDVYTRLRQKGGLWDRHRSRLPDDDARSGYAFIRHLRVLDWRSKEMLTSEAIASRFGAERIVLATKHQQLVLRNYLAGRATAYLSHPITEIRRIERSGVQAKKVEAKQVRITQARLQELLCASLTLFQPTTIDEYRIQTDTVPRLTARFYPHSHYEDNTLYSPVTGDANDVIFDDLPKKTTRVVKGSRLHVARYLAAIALQHIEPQVTARDHQLVVQSEYLIVYRPKFNGNLAGGVKREMEYFDRLAELGLAKQAVIVLTTEEDEARFLPRVFLERMIAAASDGTWSVPLDSGQVIDYQAGLTIATENLIRTAFSTRESSDAAAAVEAVLADLRLSPDWSASTTAELGTRPLDTSWMQKDMTRLDKLYERFIVPPPSATLKKAAIIEIPIDNKPLDEVLSEIMQITQPTEVSHATN